MINKFSGNLAPVELKPARDWDSSGTRFGDPAKAKSKLGFSTNVSIEEGLEKTINRTKQNIPEVKRCMRQHVSMMPDIKKYL